jgi:hypothetical protein
MIEPTWRGDDEFSILGVDFVSSHEPASTSDRFFVRKNRRLVEATIDLAARPRAGGPAALRGRPG